VPQLVLSVVLIAVALSYHLSLLRPHGGWIRVYAGRRTRSGEGSEVWRGLLPIERVWFYILPVAYLWSALVAVAGVWALIQS
jgi:hypothetical protein